MKKRNLARNLFAVLKTWAALRRYPGLFRWPDAALQLNRVLLPARFHYRAGGRRLGAETTWRQTGDAFEVTITRQQLKFYWPAEPNNNLWFLIEQEFDPRNPHYYTTPPVVLGPASFVLDVGACEGLFAFRALRQGLARRVVCFEPGARMAGLLARGAEANGLQETITVEQLAVARESGTVTFQEAADAEGSFIQSAGGGGTRVVAVSLDDYCARHGLALTPRDLIKIDAEGADFEVLRGAERLIRAGSPQIAVTTYHTDEHCFAITDWLRQVEPRYRLRLKGFACWTQTPRPVLLQAAR